MDQKARKRNKKKIAKYYFENPQNNSLEEMSKKFKLTKTTISKAISEALKHRLENSTPRRCARY